jgi:hypothetical protein
MSMSEFEEQLNTWEEGFSPLSRQGHDVPADFSEEELAFAQELDSLFVPHKEEIPPYFVQTLLESDDPRFFPVEPGFEHKTRARVMRRLKVRRRLFHSGPPSLYSLISVMPIRRSLVVSASLMLFLFMTVVFTAPSFASGMTMLLRSGRTGVLLTRNYPSNVKPAPHATNLQSDSDTQLMMSLLDAQQLLHSWNMSMPQIVPDKYALTGTYIYQEPQQSWSDGPFMEFDYSLTGRVLHGMGELAIREFKLKPNASVFQVVKDGAAESIKIDKQNGLAQAIYVDGQWVLHDKLYGVWIYGQRSELIYQKDGIVFWIVGDQRDGIKKDVLLKIANSLQMIHISRLIPVGGGNNMNSVTVLNGDINGPFTGDLLAIFSDDSSVGSYLSLAGSDQTQTVPSKLTGLHTS